MIRTPQVRQKPLGGNIMQHPFEDRITMRRTHRYVLRGTGELGLNLCIPIIVALDCAPTVGIARRSLRVCAPIVICAHGGISGNGEWEDNDAARLIATSFEERENWV